MDDRIPQFPKNPDIGYRIMHIDQNDHNNGMPTLCIWEWNDNDFEKTLAWRIIATYSIQFFHKLIHEARYGTPYDSEE
tara:strand:+ start:6365 stop:6598 length:234 start_codon:yes stop_codon:yes gene_type:complete